MTGQTDIMNLALVSFPGSDHLMDRDEQDKNTRVMNLIYNPLLEKLQREYASEFLRPQHPAYPVKQNACHRLSIRLPAAR